MTARFELVSGIQIFLSELHHQPVSIDKAQETLSCYADSILHAVRYNCSIHLSKKREWVILKPDGCIEKRTVPISVDISPDGNLFFPIRHSTFARSTYKKVKKAYDVGRRVLVARSVEPVTLQTDKRRKSQEEAKKALADAPWMLKEFYCTTYSNGRQEKRVAITELMESDLYGVLEKDSQIPLSKKKHFAHQILQQLVDIHAKGFHKDLSVENVLVRGNRALIFDFDFFCGWDNAAKRAQWLGGIPRIQSPEYAKLVSKDEHHTADFTSVNTPAYDIWSMGILLIDLFYRDECEIPWDSVPPKLQGGLIARTQCEWIARLHSQTPLDFFVRWMLQIDPKKRPSAREALEYFEKNLLIDCEHIDGSPSSWKSDWTDCSDVKEPLDPIYRCSAD